MGEVSSQGIDFLNDLLAYELDQRISIERLINHPYLKLKADDLSYAKVDEHSTDAIVFCTSG